MNVTDVLDWAERSAQRQGPAIRCAHCNRFTSRRDITVRPDDVGDYGQVYSYIAECHREDCTP